MKAYLNLRSIIAKNNNIVALPFVEQVLSALNVQYCLINSPLNDQPCQRFANIENQSKCQCQ